MSTSRQPGLGPVLLTVFLDLLGFGLVIPLLSFFAESYGASALEVTLLMAIYSVAQFLGAPLWGMVSDRVGRRPVLLVSVGASVVFLVACAYAPSLLWLFVFRGLHGLCAANVGTAQAYVADVTSGKDRAKGMGLIGAAFGVGFSVGPFLGGTLSDYALNAPFLFAAVLSAINFLWVWLRLPESYHPKKGQVSERSKRTVSLVALGKTLSHPVVGACIGLMFIATFAFAMMESTFALVAEHVWGMTAREVGYLFGLIGMIGIVIQGGLIGRLSGRFGEVTLLGTGYLLNAAGMLTLAFVGPGAGVWAGCTLLAIGSSIASPSLNSLISRATAADEQGAVLGANQSFSSLARATAPVVGGLLYANWMPVGALIVGGGLMLVAVAVATPATKSARLSLEPPAAA